MSRPRAGKGDVRKGVQNAILRTLLRLVYVVKVCVFIDPQWVSMAAGQSLWVGMGTFPLTRPPWLAGLAHGPMQIARSERFLSSRSFTVGTCTAPRFTRIPGVPLSHVEERAEAGEFLRAVIFFLVAKLGHIL